MIGNMTRGKGFRGVLDYVYGGGKKEKHDRATFIGGTLAGRNPRELAREFGELRRLRPDIENPVKHISFSVPNPEKLSREQVLWTCGRVAERMGGWDSWTTVGHDDKANHLDYHMVASRITQDGNVIAEPAFDVAIVEDVCREAELRFGLRIVASPERLPSGKMKPPPLKPPTKKEKAMVERTGLPSWKMIIQNAAIDALTQRPMTMDAYAMLLDRRGIELKQNVKKGVVSGLTYVHKETGETMKGQDLGEGLKAAGILSILDKNTKEFHRETAAARTIEPTIDPPRIELGERAWGVGSPERADHAADEEFHFANGRWPWESESEPAAGGLGLPLDTPRIRPGIHSPTPEVRRGAPKPGQDSPEIRVEKPSQRPSVHAPGGGESRQVPEPGASPGTAEPATGALGIVALGTGAAARSGGLDPEEGVGGRGVPGEGRDGVLPATPAVDGEPGAPRPDGASLSGGLSTDPRGGTAEERLVGDADLQRRRPGPPVPPVSGVVRGPEGTTGEHRVGPDQPQERGGSRDRRDQVAPVRDPRDLVAQPGRAGDPGRTGGAGQGPLTPWSYADLDLARIFRREQRGPEDAQQWGNSYHSPAQEDSKLAVYCPDPLTTTAIMASLQEFQPGRDTDELDRLTLQSTCFHGTLRSSLWQHSADSGLLLPAFAEIILPHPLDLGAEQQGPNVVILGPDGRPASMWVEEAVAKAARRSQVAVPEMPAPELPQVQPKAPKPPLPPKPGFSKAAQIKEAMASPVLGLGTAPTGRNFLAPPATPPKDDWWWEQRQERTRKAEAAAQKRQMEREQKEALQRAKNAPGVPQETPKPDLGPNLPNQATPTIRPRK